MVILYTSGNLCTPYQTEQLVLLCFVVIVARSLRIPRHKCVIALPTIRNENRCGHVNSSNNLALYFLLSRCLFSSLRSFFDSTLLSSGPFHASSTLETTEWVLRCCIGTKDKLNTTHTQCAIRLRTKNPMAKVAKKVPPLRASLSCFSLAIVISYEHTYTWVCVRVCVFASAVWMNGCMLALSSIERVE